ncbi:translation elongation factor Ts [Massilia sp. W12]|uniref:translation elongation factor Ts n=1 Tax=Massilia sp. W12 TaxID=3126507 RepID=UPI0030D5CE91
MAAITAAMVGELRGKTDAPMMECKKALVEAEGDMARAEEILRVKLGGKAAKASARITAEGTVAVYVEGGVAALVEVNCETDFVSKNPEFQALADAAAKLVAKHNPADVAALGALEVDGQSLEAIRAALVGKIGENMSFRRFKRFETADKLASYLHGTRIGVMVEIAGGDEQVGKDVAMHIAAMKPVALSSDQVSAELIERERSVATLKAQEDNAKLEAEGKSRQSDEIIAKRIEGAVQKYLKEVSLLNQAFVKNDKQTVEAMLKAAGATVKSFTLYVVGEGIEKKVDDFAAEVAAQVAAAKG